MFILDFESENQSLGVGSYCLVSDGPILAGGDRLGSLRRFTTSSHSPEILKLARDMQIMYKSLSFKS